MFRWIALVVMMFACSLVWAVTPILGADCGVGAIIDGSKNAGKITLGTGVQTTCTLGFSWPKVPSCAAVNETRAQPTDTLTTATTLQIGYGVYQTDGDVISYLCIGQ